MLSASILKSIFEFQTWIPNLLTRYLENSLLLDSSLKTVGAFTTIYQVFHGVKILYDFQMVSSQKDHLADPPTENFFFIHEQDI